MHPIFAPSPILPGVPAADQIGPLRVLVLVLGLATAAPVQAQPSTQSPIQATDLYNLREIRDVTLSPSGRFVAYTVRQIVKKEGDQNAGDAAYRTRLYVRSSRGQDARLLTRTERGARQPDWHPEGSRLAFVRSVNGTPQIFIISMSGGEPYQLTDAPYGAQDPQWGPSGERVLFASAVPQSFVRNHTSLRPPSERPGRRPGDLRRDPAPDTILVLRHAQSLDPIDTLDVDAQGRARVPGDTTRTLRTPRTGPMADSLATLLTDNLSVLSPDSIRVLLDNLRLHPDTTAVPVVPDTVATPDGSLVQMRRWMNQNGRRTAVSTSRLEFRGNRGARPVPRYRHYFVVDVPDGIRTGNPSRPSVRVVTTGYRSFGTARWLPGGSQLVVSGTPRTTRHPDRIRKRNLYVVDVNRDRMRRLLEIEHHALTSPRLTTDGTMVAFRIRPLKEHRDEQVQVGLFALNGRSEPRIITSTLDRDVREIRWSPGGWYLYATAPSRGGVPIFRFSPFSPDTTATPTLEADQAASRDTFALDSTMVRPAPHRQMTASSRTVHHYDVTDATAVYAATDPETPSALYTNTVSFANERRISNQNQAWLSRRRISTPRRIVARSDSLRIEGWVTRPTGASNSVQHPFVVMVRGGPGTLDALHTPERWFERQFLASRRVGVVEVSPRGSRGYGQAFRRANDRNWGPGPAADVVALADSAATLAWTDSTQQAIAGASYGATLATWLIGHTDRFDAAIGLNGIYDLSALADGGRAWRVVPQEFDGFPWEGAPPLDTDPPLWSVGTLGGFVPEYSAWRTLHQNSPTTYADQIHTPLLLLQGTGDHRVGPPQGKRLYKRLKILGRPAEYVAYPRVGRDVAATATPRQRIDRLVRTYEFLARFLEVPSASRTQ